MHIASNKNKTTPFHSIPLTTTMTGTVPKRNGSKAQHRQTCLLSYWGKAIPISSAACTGNSNSSKSQEAEASNINEGAAAAAAATAVGSKRKPKTSVSSSSLPKERNKKQKELATYEEGCSSSMEIACGLSSPEINKSLTTTTTNAVSPTITTTTTTRPCNDSTNATTAIIEEEETENNEKRDSAVPTSNKGRPSTNNDGGDASKTTTERNNESTRQEGNAEAAPLVDTTTTTTTAHDDDDANHQVDATTTIGIDEEDNPGGLSAYERLRMRNIERNNARLVALGLVGTTATTTSVTKKATRRKRPQGTSNASQPMPTRRSTRSRRSVGQDWNTVEPTTCETSKTMTAAAVVDVNVDVDDPVEEFTVSPLLQYAMNNRHDEHNGNENGNGVEATNDDVAQQQQQQQMQGEMTSLSPVGPRLQPPKGLGAIYTLQFFPFQATNNTNDNTNTNTNTNDNNTWLVGAGKAGIVALWDCRNGKEENASVDVDPVLSWKAHGGRWIAEARFLPGPTTTTTCTTSTSTPSRLLTAANDGTVCLWDLTTVSIQSGVPKRLLQSGKELHTSGIFAMDVITTTNNNNDSLICTGSKDKTVAVSSLESIGRTEPMWRSTYHSGKVGAVQLRGSHSTLLASASDDGQVAIHDYRTNGNTVVAALPNAHERPHSVVWDPYSSSRDHNRFLTGTYRTTALDLT
jgi:hypothetical protein